MTCHTALKKEVNVHGIWRAGLPTTIASKVRVPLTESPPLAWRHAFDAAMHATPADAARSVTIVDGAIVFACDPGDVDQTVALVDEWIARANAAAPAPTARPWKAHAGDRDLTWEEQRVVAEAARRADQLKDY